MSSAPPDVTMALARAARPGISSDGWLAADEVRSRVVSLGFTRTGQQIAARLGRMSRVGLAERRDTYDVGLYRLTAGGRDLIVGHFPRLQPRLPWLATFRGSA